MKGKDGGHEDRGDGDCGHDDEWIGLLVMTMKEDRDYRAALLVAGDSCP